jgi:hypothetical protein
MQARYRADYPGEFIVIEATWQNGKKEEKREWIPNPIENQHISGRAACIGSNIDQEFFDYTHLQHHRGGLLGSKKLQTYGNSDIAKQMRLDFAVEKDLNKLTEIIKLGYQEDNIVYTSPTNCLIYPGEFYIVPYNPRLCDVAQLLYLAAFDGHKEIFMLGYNKESQIESLNWIENVREVMDAYPGIIFHMVGEKTNMPDLWMEAYNTKNLSHQEFIYYCDV